MLAPIYKPGTLEERYDVVVIGSGIGGLATAALLGQAGKKVLVLERHYMPGGFTHTFSRKGYEWDVGLHYVGEVNRANSALKKIFDRITDGRLRWAPMPAVYDKVCIRNEVYNYEAPRQKLRANLEAYFPAEKAGIERYFQAVDTVARETKSFFMEKALPPLLGRLGAPFLCKGFRAWSDRTTLDVLRECTSDPKLIGVLAAQYGDYGLPPKQSSFAVHAIITKHYFDGGNYPIGGSSQIYRSISPVLEANGCQVRVKAEVESVLLNKGKTAGVRLKGGEEIASSCVISDAGVDNTYRRLLPKDYALPGDIERLLSATRPSAAHLCLYGGIRESPEELGVTPSNYWIYPDYDHDKSFEAFRRDPESPLAVTYLSFPSAKDPEWNGQHPGRSTIEAITFAPYEWFQQWESSGWNRREEAYEALKERFAQRMLEQVYRWVPGLKGKLDYYEISTPLSTRHFANYPHGEIYGLDHAPGRFRERWLRPHTPIPGLFLTGQDIVTDGIGGALMGGVLTASAVTRKNVLKEIL